MEDFEAIQNLFHSPRWGKELTKKLHSGKGVGEKRNITPFKN